MDKEMDQNIDPRAVFHSGGYAKVMEWYGCSVGMKEAIGLAEEIVTEKNKAELIAYIAGMFMAVEWIKNNERDSKKVDIYIHDDLSRGGIKISGHN